MYLSFGYVQLVSPAGWVSYLPGILQRLPVDGQFFIFLNGTMEIVLGLLLLLGILIRPSAFILGVHLFVIAATIGFNAVGIRDFGLSLATLGVAFAGNDSFSLEGYARKRNLLARAAGIFGGYVLVALLSGVALAFSIQMYDGPFLSVQPSGTSAREVSEREAPPGTTLSAAVVGSHALPDDCWIIVNGRVYAVTEYIPFHPGGEKRITDLCGADATTAFATKGGMGSEHSSNAKTLLEKYFVGLFGETVSADATKTALAGQSGADVQAAVVMTPTPAASQLPVPTPAVALTAAVVASHNRSSDCWIIVSGNVYNVTAYIPFHPGGTNRIVSVCGQDATTAFNTRGGTGSHSTYAKGLLSGYLVGALGATATLTPSPTPIPTPMPTATPTPATTPTSGLTAANVATHNSAASCWLIISNNVYDVTAYIPFHPGGTNRIVSVCGREATTAFQTRGGGGSHSTYAHNLLAGYLLGPLVAGPTSTPGLTPTPSLTPTPVPSDPAQPYRDTILAQYPGANITKLAIEDNGSAEFKFTYNGSTYEGKMNSQYQITEIQ